MLDLIVNPHGPHVRACNSELLQLKHHDGKLLIVSLYILSSTVMWTPETFQGLTEIRPAMSYKSY